MLKQPGTLPRLPVEPDYVEAYPSRVLDFKLEIYLIFLPLVPFLSLNLSISLRVIIPSTPMYTVGIYLLW